MRVLPVLLAAIKAQSSGFSFWLLSETGSAIICLVSRKAILGTLIFDIGGDRKIAAIGPKGQNLLPPWQKSTAKKEPGNPDKDLGTSSVVHNERRRATYAILRIWL